MNEVIAHLLRHRSVRRFTPEPVPLEHIREAVRAGQAASTSSAVQAYGVIHVRDPIKRRRLVELTGGQEKVAACGAFLVVCGDTRRHRLAGERDGLAHDTRLESFLVAVIDASLMAQNMAVAFESMGYGICFIGGIRNHLAEVDALLNIPHGVYPLFGLCVGHADEPPWHRPRLPVEAVLFEESYPDDQTLLELMARYDEAYARAMEARGAAPRAWSRTMAVKHSHPEREAVASYYASKGARLE